MSFYSGGASSVMKSWMTRYRVICRWPRGIAWSAVRFRERRMKRRDANWGMSDW